MNLNEIIEIRPYKDSDLEKLYEICLKTGDSGKDATNLYNDPKLIGHYYCAPYAAFEPGLAFIVTINDEPSGYVLGTKNSVAFSKKCESEWFPKFRQKYPLPKPDDTSKDANIIRLIHQGYDVKKELIDFPAHLHIDLLPVLQGRGLGRKLINTFVNRLKAHNVEALHLEVGRKNIGAIEFYKRIGFIQIAEYEYSIAFGMKF